MHTLENDQLCVTISDHGAELSGIFDKKNDREILWNADPSHWKRHAPVLFPNVGRYYEDHCLINGKTYTSGQHGFAHRKKDVGVHPVIQHKQRRSFAAQDQHQGGGAQAPYTTFSLRRARGHTVSPVTNRAPVNCDRGAEWKSDYCYTVSV